MIPSIGGMLGLSMCIFLDTMFIGRGIGDVGLAALNISIPFFSLFAAFSLLTGIGGATLASINIGKKRYDRLDEIFTLSMVVTILIGITTTILGIVFMKEILNFLGTSGLIRIYVKEYLQVILIGATAFIVSTTLNVFVRNDGSPKLSMFAIIGSNTSNIILDYLFIFKFGMGMRGASLATTISQIVGISILLLHFILKKNSIKFKLSSLNFRYLKRILTNGFPSFILEISAGVVIVLFNLKLKDIGGDISISAYSIIANFSLIVIAIFNGIAQGLQPIISVNYGAQKIKRILKTYKIGFRVMFIVSGVFFGFGEIAPGIIIKIFSKDNTELFNIAILGIKLYFISFIPMGLNILNVSFLQSIEKSKKSIVLSLLRGLVLIIICLDIFSKLWGLNGIWLTTPGAEIITLILSVVLIIKEERNLKKMI